MRVGWGPWGWRVHARSSTRMGGLINRVDERVVLHELRKLDVNKLLHGFLLALGSWVQAEILKEALELNIWGWSR